MGLKPGKRMAVLAGASEAGGGALLATGLLTPLGSTAIIGVMSQAIESRPQGQGLLRHRGRLRVQPRDRSPRRVAIADHGPGPISLDRALGIEKKGTLVALAVLAAGLAGPQLVKRLSAGGEEPAPATRGRRRRRRRRAEQEAVAS